MKRTVTIGAIAGILGLGMACNHAAQPETNASVSEQQGKDVKTPAGGGSETTNKRSVPEQKTVSAENIRQGSAVPPAAADQSRPHPQQQASQASQPNPTQR